MKRDITANISFCYYFVSLHALAALAGLVHVQSKMEQNKDTCTLLQDDSRLENYEKLEVT